MPEQQAEFITAQAANDKIASTADEAGFVHCHRSERDPVVEHQFSLHEAGEVIDRAATLDGVLQIAFVDRGEGKSRCLHVYTPDHELYVFPDVVP